MDSYSSLDTEVHCFMLQAIYWMSFVDTTNKKLIDRAVRLISSLGKISYETACELLFEAKERQLSLPEAERESPVQMVLKKIK